MISDSMQYFSPREVGEMLGTSGDTIRRLIKSCELEAIRMPPGYYYKITAAEVLRYVSQHNIPLTEVHRRLLEGSLAEEFAVA